MARGIRKSLIGRRFGKLTVIGYEGVDKFRNALWLCECDCGNKIVVKGTWLTKGLKGIGKVVSCGSCENKFSQNEPDLPEDNNEVNKSLVGQRFGRLVIKDIFKKKAKNGENKVFAKCICDCGKEKDILLVSLKTGKTTSCGCYHREKHRKTKFNLTDDFVGQRFGKLTVIGYDDEKKRWKVQCDCGNIVYLLKSQLTIQKNRSCGHCNGRKTKNRRTEVEFKNGEN